ncbi:hypothetical protein [uncultured Mediterranean phage uvMED]|nr:hypothetical protein [uncultured Mediterranean phage uvMED]BAQ89150.1 hypothetical protein [uncultured Mediterranean phage uvMED]
MSLPNENDAWLALQKINETNLSYAQAFAKCAATEKEIKVAKMRGLPDSGTVIEREKRAILSQIYLEACGKNNDAIFEKVHLEVQRESWMLTFKFWQSLNANMRQS